MTLWPIEIVERRGGRCGFLVTGQTDPDTLARQFGLKPTGALDEVNAGTALTRLEALLWKDMAYTCEVMPRERAHELARQFINTFETEARFFTNGDWERLWSSPVSWTPCTDSTFDGGVIAIARHPDGRQWLAGCAWFEDED